MENLGKWLGLAWHVKAMKDGRVNYEGLKNKVSGGRSCKNTQTDAINFAKHKYVILQQNPEVSCLVIHGLMVRDIIGFLEFWVKSQGVGEWEEELKKVVVHVYLARIKYFAEGL